MREAIRAEAQRLGFARCGFARIETPPHADFLHGWLAAGNAAEMAYIERGLPKRLDPGLIVPGARSVITVGYRYLPPPLPPTDWQQTLRGRIAAYAFGTDYHRTIEHKLRELAVFVRGMGPDIAARPYVDTGPVLEREWAAAGGVGWFGKNTNILHADEGSYFFLGELLTTLDLEPDPPVADRCGTCAQCLDRCPTQALRPGYVLDARLCISYLTIEHRGAIPVELRPQIGNWIFGCDVCQEVCPWNERLVRREGTPTEDALLPFLPDLLRLDDERFRERFRNTAIRRARREGFVRNVAVALGNTRSPEAVPPLLEGSRRDSSSLVRAHIAWALGEIGGAAARRALDQAWRSEPTAEVRAEITAALERLG